MINEILNIRDSYQAPQKIMEILYGDIEKRNKIFMEFLEAFNKDVNYDWFHEYFQDEHANRKKHKQDFTPQSVSRLLVEMVGDAKGDYYEPAAGTGGIVIEKWNKDLMSHSPFDYLPSLYFYTAEELSDRTIPFLLFNMIIRGMNGLVIQCDVLTREAYGAWFIQNDNDDHLGFSSLNRLPYTAAIEKELNIKFVEEKYPDIKQTKKVPEHVVTQFSKTTLQDEY